MKVVEEPAGKLKQVGHPCHRRDDVGALAPEHGASDVGGEKAHALQRQGDLDAGVLLARRGGDDLCLDVGQRASGDLEGADGRHQGEPLGVHLEADVLVELSPDVELDHVSGSDDVRFRIDLPILGDAQPLHFVALGQQYATVAAIGQQARRLGARDSPHLLFLALGLIHELLEILCA